MIPTILCTNLLFDSNFIGEKQTFLGDVKNILVSCHFLALRPTKGRKLDKKTTKEKFEECESFHLLSRPVHQDCH